MGRFMLLLKKAKALVSLKRSTRKFQGGAEVLDAVQVNAGCHDSHAERLPEKVEITTNQEEWITAAASPGTELEITIPIPSSELESSSLPNGHIVDHEAEERAAVKIQAAFRGAMARKKLKALKAFARLKTVLRGRATKKQTSNAMRCMQSLAKVQSQVRTQRARLTDFQAQKIKEHDEARKSTEEELEDWDHSVLSKEQISARIRNRRQAAAKRERTLAYAFSHQLWRSYPKDLSQTPETLDKPAWSWSWLEQWMASRNWESLEEGKQHTRPSTLNGKNKINIRKHHTKSNGHHALKV